MTYIIFETSQKILLFKTPDVDAAQRATSGDTAIQYIHLTAEYPFASTDESAQFCADIQDATYSDQIIQFFKQNVQKGSKILVQDQRLNKTLEAAGFMPEQSAQTFRVVRHHIKTLTKQNEEEALHASRALAHASSRHVCQFDKNKSDQQIIQGIGYYETILKDINNQSMKLAECVGFHFPEFKRIVEDQDLYVLFAYILRSRVYMQAHTQEKLCGKIVEQIKELGLETSEKIEKLVDKVYKAAAASTGCDFGEPELDQLKLVQKKVFLLLKEKYNLIQFLDSKLKIVAPNVHVLLGTLNGARLIAKAGNLSKLAKAPASTVQLFGAEKALFRVLKRHSTKTPKYGLLFKSIQVQACKNLKSRGRVARALACCVARCARVDYYGEKPTTSYGEAMHKLIDQRIAFYDGVLKGEMLRMTDLVSQMEQMNMKNNLFQDDQAVNQSPRLNFEEVSDRSETPISFDMRYETRGRMCQSMSRFNPRNQQIEDIE